MQFAYDACVGIGDKERILFRRNEPVKQLLPQIVKPISRFCADPTYLVREKVGRDNNGSVSRNKVVFVEDDKRRFAFRTEVGKYLSDNSYLTLRFGVGIIDDK